MTIRSATFGQFARSFGRRLTPEQEAEQEAYRQAQHDIDQSVVPVSASDYILERMNSFIQRPSMTVGEAEIAMRFIADIEEEIRIAEENKNKASSS